MICLVMAAGNSQRFQASRSSAALRCTPSKLYEILPDDPEAFAVLARCLERCLAYPGFSVVQPVIHPSHQEAYDRLVLRRLPASLTSGRLLDPVFGGSERTDSVKAGIEHIQSLVDTDRLRLPEAIMVHDGARPWLSLDLFARLHNALRQGHEAVIPILPVSDTLRHCPEPHEAGSVVPRDHYALVQAPQAFTWQTLRRAYQSETLPVVTDDASLCEAMGVAVTTVPGEIFNRKVTFWDDIHPRTQAVQPQEFCTRVATGFDLHRFALLPSERPAESAESFVMLGGVAVPHWCGVVAHSDGDVILHALVDALLSLAGAGDIGEHFPPSDPQWQNVASAIFVDHAKKIGNARGVVVSFVDMMVVCEKPKILPYRQAIRASVAHLLGIPLEATALRGKTNEGLGHLGRQEGLSAWVTVTATVPK
jgi:2-C-methyl-D-erythritol 4-phosphate cytidylyltransferase/2-C-methyl-D-erythritol 2,4-cyclodiphosphate synthase